jgi:hypothetical protein
MKIKNVFSILALLLIVSFIVCKKDDKTGSIPAMATTDPLNYY